MTITKETLLICNNADSISNQSESIDKIPELLWQLEEWEKTTLKRTIRLEDVFRPRRAPLIAW